MTVNLVIKNQMIEFTKVAREVSEIGVKHALGQETVNDLTLILEEIISNVILHGYDDPAVHDIEIAITINGNLVRMTVVDDGKPFNPTTAEQPNLDVPLEERDDGGMGIYLVKRISNDMAYARRTDKNILTIIKKIDE